MIDDMNVDVLVIGAGPAGLAAAIGAKKEGASKVIVLEREQRPGGILNQCIHEGFGLVRYNKALTGTEYACRIRAEADAYGVEVLTNSFASSIQGDLSVRVLSGNGAYQINARSIVMATGCRERTRGNLVIPGTRPAGIFTAGVAQNLVNVQNAMIGNRVLILGSGDIGLIMARRLTLEGSRVVGVVEMRPEPSGLQRNVVQCVLDFDIPLITKHTVTNIYGKDRVSAVEIAEVSESGSPIKGTEKTLECDTIVLSVGLVPENELLKDLGISANTGGVPTDEYMQTEIDGIFSCGNSRSISDLVDFVSEEGELAGRNAAAFASGKEMIPRANSATRALPKGFPESNAITCILCPKGCKIHVSDTGAISGNGCARGFDFCMQELVEPKRVLTTTLKMKNGGLIPVKSAKPFPKEQLRQVCSAISGITVEQNRIICGEMIEDANCPGGVGIIATDSLIEGGKDL